MHQPTAGERAGTSRGHNVKIVLESPGARLCRTMITRGGGGRNDNEENGSDSTPHYASIGKKPGLHIPILGMKLLIVITNSCFRPKTNMNLFPAHRPGEISFLH